MLVVNELGRPPPNIINQRLYRKKKREIWGHVSQRQVVYVGIEVRTYTAELWCLHLLAVRKWFWITLKISSLSWNIRVRTNLAELVRFKCLPRPSLHEHWSSIKWHDQIDHVILLLINLHWLPQDKNQLSALHSRTFTYQPIPQPSYPSFTLLCPTLSTLSLSPQNALLCVIKSYSVSKTQTKCLLPLSCVSLPTSLALGTTTLCSPACYRELHIFL